MKTEKFPTLYKTTSKGETQEWTIEVRNNGAPKIVRMFGRLGGKIQTNIEEITEGKNIGRANETTPWEQAVLVATSKWKKQVELKGYGEKIGVAGNTKTLPMLAKNLRDSKTGEIKQKWLEFPLLVQPKLNGVRCMSDKKSSWSRGTKPYPLVSDVMGDDINFVLSHLPKGTELDGEIYIPDVEFEEITSAVKKRNDLTDSLQYYVFDVKPANMEEGFLERYQQLEQAVALDCFSKKTRIVLVPIYEINSIEELIELHDRFVQEGYEGIIIRTFNGVYKSTHRSKDLLKYKCFIDEEFEIIGGKEGKGNDKGTCIFECKASNGKTFDCRPKGSVARRTEYFNNLETYIGQKLTVRYQNISKYGKPIFPVGIDVRNYE